MRAEHLSEEVFMDIGFREEIFAECHSVAFYFFARHRQGGNKLAQQSVYGMHRDFPNAEETQDVVDTVGIEVFRHLAETLHPPGITVFLHYVPVVSREAPVLTVHGEVIGWCARLSVQVEVVGFCPRFYAVAADADRNVTFQYYTIGSCVFRCSQQLQVQVELDEEVDGDMRIVGRFRLA